MRTKRQENIVIFLVKLILIEWWHRISSLFLERSILWPGMQADHRRRLPLFLITTVNIEHQHFICFIPCSLNKTDNFKSVKQELVYPVERCFPGRGIRRVRQSQSHSMPRELSKIIQNVGWFSKREREHYQKTAVTVTFSISRCSISRCLQCAVLAFIRESL